MPTRIGLAAAALALMSSPAFADEERFFVRAGAANIDLSPDDVEMELGGFAVAGADFSVTQDTVGVVEGGWHVTPHWAVSGMITLEATTENVGAGTLAGLPIGEDSFVLAALMGQYHFDQIGPLKPYVGVGVSYFHATDTQDGAVTDLEVDDSTGSVVQFGVEAPVNDKFSVYADVKQFFIALDTSGTFGAPVTASADVDPFMFSAGVSFRF